MVGSNYINPEANYGPLIDFLSKISKLSYIKVLDLADFMMYCITSCNFIHIFD